MSSSGNRVKKVSIMYIAFHLLFTGCSKQKEEQKEVATTSDYKVVYIDQKDEIEIKKMTSESNLPISVQDDLTTIYSYNKIYSYQMYKFADTEKITALYTCDPITDHASIKLKDFKGKQVEAFIEFEDSYIYAYLEDDEKMSVVQEKDGVVKTIATATVYNHVVFSPRFYVSDNQLLFLLTDTVVENEGKTIDVHQRFLSFKDGKLETLYKTDFSVIDNIVDAEADQIKTQFLVQGDGKMMFQVKNKKGTILFKYHKGKITQQHIDDTNYFLIGYLENSAIFLDENSNTYVLYDLEKNTTIPIDFSEPMYYAMIYNNTVMYFNDKRDKLWALCLKKEGGYTLIDMDKIIYEKMNIKDPSEYTNFLFPIGDTIYLAQRNPKNVPVYTSYSLKYVKN